MEKLKSSGSLDHHIEKGTAVGEKTGTPRQTVSMSQVVQFFSSLDINSTFGQKQSMGSGACLLEFKWQDFLPFYG